MATEAVCLHGHGGRRRVALTDGPQMSTFVVQCDRLPRRQHKTKHTCGSLGQIELLAHVDIRVVVELGHGWGRPPRTQLSSGDRQRLSHAN